LLSALLTRRNKIVDHYTLSTAVICASGAADIDLETAARYPGDAVASESQCMLLPMAEIAAL
jgi:hypothetical protein